MKGEKNKIYVLVAIATSFIMTFIMFIGCMYNNSVKFYEGFYGAFHAEVVLKDKDLYKKINRKLDVRDTGYINVRRYRLCNDKTVTYARSNLDGVGVGSLNKDVLKLFKVELSSGRLPKNNKEIILSDYYDIGEGNIKVGDDIELKLDAKSAADVYTVVGTYKDYIREFQYNENEHLNGQFNALTYDDKTKITDGSVVYVRCFKYINMNPYKMLRKMGIKDNDIYTNNELIDLLNIESLLEYNIDGPKIIIGQVSIIIMLIIAAYILLYKSFRKIIRSDVDEEKISSYETIVEKKKYIQTIADDKINKKILAGIGIGIIISIIINIIICLFSKGIMIAFFSWYYKLKFSISVIALLIGIIVADIIICLAKNNSVKSITGEICLDKEKLSKKKNIVGIVISSIIIIACVVTTLALDKKYKEPVASYKNTFVDDNINYDIRVSDEVYLETNTELEDYSKEENEKAKEEITKKFKNVKKELSAMPIDEITSMPIRSTNEVYIDEYNEELKKTYKDAWYDYENVKSVIKLKEIYLDEEHYKALIKDNKLKEEKYINVDNPPAIVFNVRRLYEDSYTYHDGKILKENQKELKTKEDKIVIGDMINQYVEEVQPEEQFLEGVDLIYVCYPERCMKEINAFTIDIRVDDYDKVEAEFKKWYDKNSSSDMRIFTPTARLREETTTYKDKMSTVYLITGIIALLAFLNILRIKFFTS